MKNLIIVILLIASSSLYAETKIISAEDQRLIKDSKLVVISDFEVCLNLQSELGDQASQRKRNKESHTPHLNLEAVPSLFVNIGFLDEPRLADVTYKLSSTYYNSTSEVYMNVQCGRLYKNKDGSWTRWENFVEIFTPELLQKYIDLQLAIAKSKEDNINNEINNLLSLR